MVLSFQLMFFVKMHVVFTLFLMFCFVFCFAGAMQDLQNSREKLEDLWSARKMKLELALQLRVFEREAIEVLLYVLHLLFGL